MGFGMVLGGLAKGITDQQELGMKNNALKLQTAELQNNQAYRNAALGMEQKRLDATTGIEKQNQARTLYASGLESIKATVTAALKNNNTPQQINDAIAGPLGYLVNVVGPAAGIPGQVTAQTVSAMIGVGSPSPSPSDQLGEVLANWRAGKKLSPQDTALLDNYQRSLSLGQAVTSEAASAFPNAPKPFSQVGAEPAAPAAAAAPAAPAAMASPTAAPAQAPAPPPGPAKAPPPIPKNLVGKNPHWSPSDPSFFFLGDGTITDLQGRAVGKLNATAQ